MYGSIFHIQYLIIYVKKKSELNLRQGNFPCLRHSCLKLREHYVPRMQSQLHFHIIISIALNQLQQTQLMTFSFW